MFSATACQRETTQAASRPQTESVHFGGAFAVQSAAGLGAPSLEATGFGTRFVDVGLDGVLDLVAVNVRSAIPAGRYTTLQFPGS